MALFKIKDIEEKKLKLSETRNSNKKTATIASGTIQTKIAWTKQITKVALLKYCAAFPD